MDNKGHRPVRKVREDVLRALSSISDSKELLARMEVLSKEIVFGGLTPIWGPALYQRAPLIFRSFILRHFSTHQVEPNWKIRPLTWAGEYVKDLEGWLNATDDRRDVQLYRRLFAWKLRQWSTKIATEKWREHLVLSMGRSDSVSERRFQLEKADLGYWLNEETAIALYRIDSNATAPFILRHLPRAYGLFSGEQRKLWGKLAKIAQENRDQDFYFKLYREQVPIKQWGAEALALCTSIDEPERLLEELERRHPATWSSDLGDTYCQLLEVKGTMLFPYIIPKLNRVSRGLFGGSYGKLLALASKNEWLDLWAGLVRTRARPKEYNQAIKDSLKLEESKARRRLHLLSGMSGEWNFAGVGFATYIPLDDGTAEALYLKFPELLRGPFKAQINPTHLQPYPRLLAALRQNQDENLIDFLASRVVTRDGRWGQEKVLLLADELTEYYESLRADPVRFAERAASVISQVPAYVLWNYSEVIRKNKLARLFYERKPRSFLASQKALTDLIEAPEIHSQDLAYRALASSDSRARELAPSYLPLLLAGLLRPLHRRTRKHCFGALLNAVRDPETAEIALNQAREAEALAALRYPKEELVGLIAGILFRFPSLQRELEREVVYSSRGRKS